METTHIYIVMRKIASFLQRTLANKQTPTNKQTNKHLNAEEIVLLHWYAKHLVNLVNKMQKVSHAN